VFSLFCFLLGEHLLLLFGFCNGSINHLCF
jgi:hypothetical protein